VLGQAETTGRIGRGDQAQCGPEHLGQRGNGPGGLDPAGPGVRFGYLHPEPGQHPAYQGQVGVIRPVLRCKPFSGQRHWTGDQAGRQFRFSAGNQGDLDPRRDVKRAGRLRTGNRPALAAG
jgi:hypothetical protein